MTVKAVSTYKHYSVYRLIHYVLYIKIFSPFKGLEQPLSMLSLT